LQLCQAAPSIILPILGIDFQAILWLTKHCLRLINKVEETEGSTIYEDIDYRIILADTLLLMAGITTAVKGLNTEQKAALDDHKFMSSIIHLCIEECEIDDESAVSNALIFALFGISSQFPVTSENPVVCGLYLDPQAVSIGQCFITIINRGTSLMDTPVLIAGLLLLKQLLEFSLQEINAEASFFYVNDIHVLVDVIIRELANIDEDSQLNAFYLALLYAIVTHPEFSNHTYKYSEIAEIVSVVSHNESNMHDDVCVHTANSILQHVNKN